MHGPHPKDRTLFAETAAAKIPMIWGIGPDGRLVISSQDTAALDLLEELLAQLVPATVG